MLARFVKSILNSQRLSSLSTKTPFFFPQATCLAGALRRISFLSDRGSMHLFLLCQCPNTVAISENMEFTCASYTSESLSYRSAVIKALSFTQQKY